MPTLPPGAHHQARYAPCVTASRRESPPSPTVVATEGTGGSATDAPSLLSVEVHQPSEERSPRFDRPSEGPSVRALDDQELVENGASRGPLRIAQSWRAGRVVNPGRSPAWSVGTLTRAGPDAEENPAASLRSLPCRPSAALRVALAKQGAAADHLRVIPIPVRCSHDEGHRPGDARPRGRSP